MIHRDQNRISAQLDILEEETDPEKFQELQTRWHGKTVEAVLDNIAPGMDL